MKTYLKLSIVYFCFAAIFTPFFLETKLTGFAAVSIAIGSIWGYIRIFIAAILIGIVILVLLVDRKTLRTRIPTFIIAIYATLLMHSGYGLLKNVMPYVTPFFADPFMAEFDKVLHFGVDPWEIAHDIAGYLPVNRMSYVYMIIWGLPATILPMFIAILDGNHARSMRMLAIYVVAWVFLGNVMAFAGLSAGPVYYDRLLDGDRFADLTAVLASSGVSASNIGYIQQGLWDIYTGNSIKIGSGISAFPSVHVGVAAVMAIYMCEISKWLFPIAALFLLTILYYSVYIGFHYAIDGYFSILVIFGVWWILKHKYSPS